MDVVAHKFVDFIHAFMNAVSGARHVNVHGFSPEKLLLATTPISAARAMADGAVSIAEIRAAATARNFAEIIILPPSSLEVISYAASRTHRSDGLTLSAFPCNRRRSISRDEYFLAGHPEFLGQRVFEYAVVVLGQYLVLVYFICKGEAA